MFAPATCAATTYKLIGAEYKSNDLLKGLAEEVPRTLQLGAFVARDELGEVGGPDILDVRPLEERHATFVHLKRVLIVLLLLRMPSSECQLRRLC